MDFFKAVKYLIVQHVYNLVIEASQKCKMGRKVESK